MSNNTPPTTGGFSIFGGQSSSSTAPSNNNVFGSNAQSSTSSTSAPSGEGQTSVFGGTNNQSGGFGALNQSNSASQTNLSGNLFGSGGEVTGSSTLQEGGGGNASSVFSTPNKPSSNQAQTGNLFGQLASNQSASAPSGSGSGSGSATPTTSKPSFSLGNFSTTPAGNPPSPNLFPSLRQPPKNSGSDSGVSQSTSQAAEQPLRPAIPNIFSAQQQASSSTSQTSGSLFGSAGPASGSNAVQSPQGISTASPFSITSTTAGNANSAYNGNKLSTAPQVGDETSSGLAPQSSHPTQGTSTAQQPSLLANANSTSLSTPTSFAIAGSTSSPASNLFANAGSINSSASNPFANAGSTNSSAPNLFANVGSTSSSAPNLFANASSTSSSAPNPFAHLTQNQTQNQPQGAASASSPFSGFGQSTRTASGPSGSGLFANLGQGNNAGGGDTTVNAQANTPVSGPSASNLFGNLGKGINTGGESTASNQANTAASGPSVSNLFGNLGKGINAGGESTASNQANTTTSVSSGSSLFANLGQGNNAGVETTVNAQANTTALVPNGSGLFGNLGRGNITGGDSTANTETNTSAASNSAPAATSVFGGQSRLEQGPSTSRLGVGTGTSAIAPTATTATAATPATLGSSTSGPPPTAQSRLKNKSMDEIITRWASDLAKYQKEFQVQAEKVAEWDRMLLENGNALSKLYSKTFQAERDTAEVEKQISTVEAQQDELKLWLDMYERDVDEMMSRQVGQGEGLQGPDQDRERTYKTAERVSERLDEMGKDLTSMIEEINDASAAISKTSKPDDPLSQIVRVLNGHLSQLQLIDQGTAELQAKVTTAQQQSRRLGSRVHGGYNDAADNFYRSYGRG